MIRPTLVAADAYLRRPSAGLVPHQMVYLQRISFACDIIEDAIVRLHSLAETHGASIPGDGWQHAALLSPCWTIVQQTYALRILLNLLVRDDQLPAVRTFVDKYEHVSHMRNLLDHLPHQTQNIAGKEKADAPVFGGLAYSVWDQASLSKQSGKTTIARKIVAIAGGPIVNKQQTLTILDSSSFSAPIRFPISWFQFSAGNHTLKIDELAEDIADTMKILSDRARQTIPESIRVEAAKLGISPEESLRDGGGNVHFVMSVTSVFDDDKSIL